VPVLVVTVPDSDIRISFSENFQKYQRIKIKNAVINQKVFDARF
jgi:hypothetical protein